MKSEKITYWLALGVFALSTATGFFTEHRAWDDRGWGDRLAERSAAVLSRASEAAAKYNGIVGMVLGSRDEDTDSEDTAQALVDLRSGFQNSAQSSIQNSIQNSVQIEVRNRLVCMQHILASRQAEMSRLQAMRVHVQMLQRNPRTMVARSAVWPDQRTAIDVPQPPLVQVDTF